MRFALFLFTFYTKSPLYGQWSYESQTSQLKELETVKCHIFEQIIHSSY